MPEMVYIKEICPDSFLYLSAKKESFALRDYSKPGAYILVAQDSPTRTTANIRAMAEIPGNYLIRVSKEGNSIDDHTFWHEQTMTLNAKYLQQQPVQNLSSTNKPWIVENLTKMVVSVTTAIIVAIILAWFGLKA